MHQSRSGSPAFGNVYQGTWTPTKHHDVAFTFLGFQFDADGVFSNYIRDRETVRLDPGGDTYTGVGTIDILDTDQNVIDSYSATTQGTRVAPTENDKQN
jgi:hypothetical protein